MSLSIHIHRGGSVRTVDFDPTEHPRGGRGQFGAGAGKPLQNSEHPRNAGGVFTQGSHPGRRSEKQKRERTDLVSNQE
jgi:hypothetical protein